MHVVNHEAQSEYGTAEWIERLILRAATVDELLSDQFEALPGQKSDADLAARRLAAWCRVSASGDWSLFARRLSRDGLSLTEVLTRFATVRRRMSAPRPEWVDDALWIVPAMETGAVTRCTARSDLAAQYAFEDLLIGAVAEAETLLWSGLDKTICASLTESASSDLRQELLRELSELCAPAFYERFASVRIKTAQAAVSDEASQYLTFVAAMKAGGLRRLFEDKPVLLRLMASLTRQWIDASQELITRLHADLPGFAATCPGRAHRRPVGGNQHRRRPLRPAQLRPHRRDHRLRDGSRIVYKPKDLRVDAAWHALIERLNAARPARAAGPSRTTARRLRVDGVHRSHELS